jgi:hypothetical protein
VDVKPAIRRRKKKRQMKWLTNLFKSKKKKEAELAEQLRLDAERLERVRKHLANIAKKVQDEAEAKAKVTKKPTLAKPVAKKNPAPKKK